MQIKRGTFSAGGDDDGDEDGNPDDEPPSPSCMDYIMHFLTLFWKILFAFIPPTGETFNK
jgi:solute carrier family 8 (sodium/calcium exchanger)